MKIIHIRNGKMPALGLGTYRLIGKNCITAVDYALSIGYRHIDTAENYGNEKEIGRGIQASGIPREDLWVTTKVWHEHLGPTQLRDAVSNSLERLSLDYLDLVLIHWPNPDVPLEDSFSAFVELQGQGMLRHIGVSNFTPQLLDQALKFSPIFCNQVEYHPFLAQNLLHRLAIDHQMALIAYSPLAQGRVLKNDTLKKIGQRYHKTSAQVTLRWLIQQNMVAAIPKGTSPKHINQNIDIFDFELAQDEMQAISLLNREERIIDPDFAPTWQR